MKILLDTHTFIWFAGEPERLSATAQQVLVNRQNILYLSLASIWEMQIKVQLGKLHLVDSLLQTINRHQQNNALKLLDIQLPHILALSNLPDHHHDPFDRLLIAQAQVEKLTLLTADSQIQRYDVAYLW